MIDEAVTLASGVCRKFEGVYLYPYLCPAGKPTIGIGSTFYENGVAVRLTDPPITRARADQLLQFHLRKTFLPGVLRLCPAVDTEGQLAALLDFAYNAGLGNLKVSTLRKKVNLGLWADVPTEFRKWTLAGGKPLKGLVLRREAEIKLVNL